MAHRAGDCVLAIIQEPDVAVSLTCTDSGSWRSMVFEFSSKKVVFSEETTHRLADAQQRLLSEITRLYGIAPREVKWRASYKVTGDGPSG